MVAMRRIDGTSCTASEPRKIGAAKSGAYFEVRIDHFLLPTARTVQYWDAKVLAIVSGVNAGTQSPQARPMDPWVGHYHTAWQR